MAVSFGIRVARLFEAKNRFPAGLSELSIQRSQSQTLRYFIAIVIGLLADLSIAFGARQLLNLPLTISAGIGLLCAVALNYVSFEYWVYSTKRFSIGRVLKTYAVSLFTLAVRALVILTASAFLVSSAIVDLAILIAAVGVSFVLNYLLIQIVFQPPDKAQDDQSG